MNLQSIKRFFTINRFNKTREAFYEDLAEAIKDKETMKVFLQSTQAYYDRQKDTGMSELYGEMLRNVGEGSWKISSLVKGIVPDGDMLILTSNDNVSNEDEQVKGFLYLAESIRNMRELKGSLVMALLTPLLVLPVLLSFILMVAYLFVPENEKILSHEHWKPSEQALYWLSYGVLHYGLVIAGVIGLFIFGFIKSFSMWHGKSRTKMESIPLLGTPYLIYRDFQAANFLTALAALMRTRMDLVTGLEKLLENSSPWMQRHIGMTLSYLRDNPTDSSGAFDTGLLSPELHQRLSSYERRSNFNEGLTRMGTEGMKHVNAAVKISSIKLNVSSLVFTVMVILSLYGTNLSITDTINEYLRQDQPVNTQ
jgi:hypothetical protein